ncbi:hypothetical protein D3C87_883650 [compost metagenome]
MGKVILSLIAIACIVIMAVKDKLQGDTLKWVLIFIIIITIGFQAFVDWKYRKSSKEQYIASLIVLVIGVTLAFFLL